MAQSSETLEIIVRMKSAMRAGMQQVGRHLDTMKTKSRELQKSLTSLQAQLTGLAASYGIGLLAKDFIDSAAAFENFRVRLNRALGSVEKGNELFAEMKKLARGSTAEYEDIMASASNLAAVMDGSVENTSQYMHIINDLAAFTGLGIQEATSQVIRMYSAGAASADLFRERGTLAMLGFQAGVSYTAEETREQLIKMYNDPLSIFRGASKDLSTTWNGIVSMLVDEWTEFQVSIMDSGVFDYLKGALVVLLEMVRQFKDTKYMKAYGDAIAKNITSKVNKLAMAAALVGDVIRGWQMIWAGVRMAFAAVVIGVSEGLKLINNRIKIVGEAIYNLGMALYELGAVELGEKIVNFGDKIIKEAAYADKWADTSSKYWQEVLKDTEMHLGQLAAQESYWSKTQKLMAKVQKTADEITKATKEGPASLKNRGAGMGGDKGQAASMEAQLKASVTRMKADAALELTILQQMYKDGSIALEDYFNQRYKIMEDKFAAEIKLAEEMARKANTADKKVQAEAKVEALETKRLEEIEKLNAQKIQLEKQYAQYQKENAITLQDLRTRIMQEGIDKQKSLHEQEILELQMKQEQELQMLRDQHASIEQLEEARRLHELEREKQQRDQIHTLLQTRLENARVIASGMSDIFGQMYADSGESVKAFFFLQKAAAAAEAMIQAHALAAKALHEGGTFMGPALATLHFAKAMVHVSAIRNQRMATGGEVQGSSPTPTADNVPIMATAGEFMQPVSAVQYYGKQIMEGIRRRSIPREVFDGLSMPPVPRMRRRLGYATGGEINAAQAGGQTDRPGGDTNIINMVDPGMMEKFAASTTGKKAIINIIREEAFEINAVLASEI